VLTPNAPVLAAGVDAAPNGLEPAAAAAASALEFVLQCKQQAKPSKQLNDRHAAMAAQV
jgi:hypothetical protein